MNSLLLWLTSPEWAMVVKTLLHSLWQGVLVATVLALALRRIERPAIRYRLALGSLVAIVLTAIVTWSVLSAPEPRPHLDLPPATPATVVAPVQSEPTEVIVVTAERTPVRPSVQWTAWIALAWLLGASTMLGRASVKVAGAERLRRGCKPLNGPRIADLVNEARRAVKLARQVRVAVTNQLTSPAVVGVLVPTLILPLSLMTTLSHEQIRFILLHELAHIRRGDYLANLFQLLTEALLFFNPAVWWISHQIRREREACCDALAIELSGAPADYAHTLVQVAENSLSPQTTAAPAFGQKGRSSTLTDRVQRMLVPGHRPSLHLTWRAILGALAIGAITLTLLAIGARETIAGAALSSATILKDEMLEPTNTSSESPPASSREVIFRFKNPSKIVLDGTAIVTIPDANDPMDNAAIRELVTIQNGEVRVEIPVGGRTRIVAGQIEGWRFSGEVAGYVVTNGPGPMVIEIPAVAAGSIAVRARNAEGTFAKDVRFSPLLVKPGSTNYFFVATHSDVLSQGEEWVSLSVPLNGAYRILGRRGNSFCLSKELTLTDQEPEVKAELQFENGRNVDLLMTDTNGTPVRGVASELRLSLANTAHGWSSRLSDSEGRIRLDGLTPGVGKYEARVTTASSQTEWVELDLSKDKTSLQLKRISKDSVQHTNPVPGRSASEEPRNKPQIKIEAKFFSLPSNQISPLGLDWFLQSAVTNSATTNLCGILTGPQAKEFLRAMEQRPGVDLMTTPILTTLSGRQGQIQVVDVHTIVTGIKPEALTPPGMTSSNGETAQFYETKPIKTGPILDVLPTLSDDGETIQLDVGVHITVLLGYGDPTNSPLAYVDGKAIRTKLPLPQVFKSEVHAKATIWDGQSLLLGGLACKESITAKHKVPVLGDLPLIGPLFRSQRNTTQEQDVFVLVTATLVDSAGERIHSLKEISFFSDSVPPQTQPTVVTQFLGAVESFEWPEPSKASATNLYTRTYKVDANEFARAVGLVGPVQPTNAAVQVRQFLAGHGISFEPPKTIFYKDSTGLLWVRATLKELDTIEELIQVMNSQPIQVNVRAKFVEMPEDGCEEFLGNVLNITNRVAGFTGILTDPQYRVILKALDQRKGVTIISPPGVTTLSGRQAQLQIVDFNTIVTGVKSVVTNGVTTNQLETTAMPFGPVLDIVPWVADDGYTVQMTLIPTVTEFLGYEKLDPGLARAATDQGIDTRLPLPRFRQRQAIASVSVWDGQTVVLGGFVSEEVTRNPDGSERKSSKPELDKKQLLVFVTPTLIDKAGNRVHSSEEMPFATNAIPMQPKPAAGE